jgi:hypothetical protein
MVLCTWFFAFHCSDLRQIETCWRTRKSLRAIVQKPSSFLCGGGDIIAAAGAGLRSFAP